MKWLNYLKIKRPTPERASQRSSRWARGSAYVRGKFGAVEEICAPFTGPDRTASKPAEGAPLRSYRMRFSAREVWPNLPGASGETLTMRISEDWLMPLR
jgi:hypothetical protein